MTPIFPKLTEREKEVLDLIIQGYSNKEICEKLVLAMPTVKCHIQNLYIKHNLFSEKGNTTMRLKLALNYLNKIIIDTKSQNKGLIEQNKKLQHDNAQGRKIIDADIEKFQEIEELCKLAKYKGGDDIYYDDILEVVQKWIYSEEE